MRDLLAPILSAALVAACGHDAPPQAPKGIDESFLDRRVDPCTDFFRFSCGTWIAQHPAQSGYVEARFYDGDQRDDTFYEMLLDPTMGESDPDMAAAQQYYGACVGARDGTRSPDFAPADALLAAVDSVSALPDLAVALAVLHESGVSALFYTSIAPDYTDTTRNVVWLSQTGWSLPSREDYVPGSSLESAYEEHMTALAGLYSGASVDPASVVPLEASIQQAALNGSSARDPTVVYNPMTTDALAARSPDFDWATYFDKMGLGSGPALVVESPTYVDALDALLTSTPLDVLKQYLKWRIVERTASSIGGDAAHEETRFHEGVVDGRTDVSPDWWVCFNETRSVFGFALAKQFVTQVVSPDPRPAARELVANIRAALRDDFQHVSWFDTATRTQAVEKLDAMVAKVGYPDPWPAGSHSFAAGASFAEMVDSITQSETRSTAQSLGVPVDRGAWGLSPSTTNAEYSPLRNDITLPVAILQDPFFSTDWSAPMIYGALGSVIGHEMTHGFDDSGRHFDGSGKLFDWWSPSASTEFNRRATCLVDQYGAYEPLPGQYVDGALTVGENIADLGGVTLAYASLEKSGPGPAGAAGFTPEQEFFLSYAQLHCADDSPEYLGSSLESDPHSPDEYRVNGVVRNVPAFADAFQCPAGAPLAPQSRCDVW